MAAGSKPSSFRTSMIDLGRLQLFTITNLGAALLVGAMP